MLDMKSNVIMYYVYKSMNGVIFKGLYVRSDTLDTLYVTEMSSYINGLKILTWHVINCWSDNFTGERNRQIFCACQL